MGEHRAGARCASLLLVGCLAAPISAQDFRQSVPQIPLPAPVTVLDAEPSLDLASQPGPAIISDLRAVRFLSDPADEPAADAIGSSGVIIVALPILDTAAFRERAARDLGKPADMASLNALARAAVEAYRAAGRPLVDVAIPEQDVTGGAVTFIVREFVVGSVQVEGNRWFATDRLRAMIRLEPGQPVDQVELVQDLNQVAENPFRRVDLFYRPGNVPLETDVIVRVQDRLPLRIYGNYSNNGQPLTGLDRWSAGIVWGDVFGRDGQLAYQYTTSGGVFVDPLSGEKVPGFTANSFTWAQPLPGASSFVIFGTFQKTAQLLEAIFGIEGRASQVSPRFILPVLTRAEQRGQLTFGYDFKQTNNDLAFGGSFISNQFVQVHQFLVDFTLSRTWTGGVLSSASTLVLSPGGLSRANSDEAFQPAPGQGGTPFAKASYAYFRSVLTQTTPLGTTGAEAVTRLSGQVASGNLLPSEQLPAAGPGFVRAYYANAVLGSQGMLATQEIWAPPIGLPRLGRNQGSLRVGGFVDAGMVGNPRRLPDEPRWVRTASVGVMGRYSLGQFVDLGFDYGTQLQQLPGQSQRESLGFLTVTVGY